MDLVPIYLVERVEKISPNKRNFIIVYLMEITEDKKEQRKQKAEAKHPYKGKYVDYKV